MRNIGEVVMVLMVLAGIAQAAGDYKAEAQPKIFKKIEAPQIPNLTEDEKARAKKIVLSDPGVLEIITGKNYRFDTGVWHNETHKLGAVVGIEAEGENFVVFVDLEKEKVVRITRIGGPNNGGGGVNPLLPAALTILLLSLYLMRKTR
ncbi:hypothetical protein [Candidatus Pyrohabitans sp.]